MACTGSYQTRESHYPESTQLSVKLNKLPLCLNFPTHESVSQDRSLPCTGFPLNPATLGERARTRALPCGAAATGSAALAPSLRPGKRLAGRPPGRPQVEAMVHLVTWRPAAVYTAAPGPRRRLLEFPGMSSKGAVPISANAERQNLKAASQVGRLARPGRGARSRPVHRRAAIRTSRTGGGARERSRAGASAARPWVARGSRQPACRSQGGHEPS